MCFQHSFLSTTAESGLHKRRTLLFVNNEELKVRWVSPSQLLLLLHWLVSYSLPLFPPLVAWSLLRKRGRARQLSRPCSGQGSWPGWLPCGWDWGRPFWQHLVGAEGHGSEASRSPLMRESCHTEASGHTHAGWKATWTPARSAGCPPWNCALSKHDS